MMNAVAGSHQFISMAILRVLIKKKMVVRMDLMANIPIVLRATAANYLVRINLAILAGTVAVAMT